MNPKSIAFHHFGCKVNFSEASALSRKFEDNGYRVTDFHEPADVYVISTCVVTAVAEKKCRAAIRQAHKINPAAKIAVIGCFPELKPEDLRTMDGVELVLGHSGKFRLYEEIEKLDSRNEEGLDYHGSPLPEPTDDPKAFVPTFSYGDRTRSFLKVQDGCDYYCTYCTIPLARGRSRSDTIAGVAANAREILTHGIREVVLTGVNIGDFGRHNGENLIGLIRELDTIEGLGRVRISSIEPDLLTDEIIDSVATSKAFLPHFHIPLQSGSNRILKLMHRKYTRELYASRVERIRKSMPGACIAADVIVGFPGETDEDFEDTYSFLEALDISYLHVFSYSRRENTKAAAMADPVPDKVRRERSDRLHALSEIKKETFYLQNRGTIQQVLFESDNTDGFMHGFTGNYIRVKTTFNTALINSVTEVALDNLDKDGIYIYTHASQS